jgi:hypothetical protein
MKITVTCVLADNLIVTYDGSASASTACTATPATKDFYFLANAAAKLLSISSGLHSAITD